MHHHQPVGLAACMQSGVPWWLCLPECHTSWFCASWFQGAAFADLAAAALEQIEENILVLVALTTICSSTQSDVLCPLQCMARGTSLDQISRARFTQACEQDSRSVVGIRLEKAGTAQPPEQTPLLPSMGGIILGALQEPHRSMCGSTDQS